MKKILLLTLLACLMFVSCNKTEPGQTTLSAGTTSVGGTTVPEVSQSRSPESTAEPTPTTTYPVLYTRPEITETHPDVVPVEPIEGFIQSNDPTFLDVGDDYTYQNVMKYAEEKLQYYTIALVTPLEIYDIYNLRMKIEYVYESHMGCYEGKYGVPSEIIAYYPILYDEATSGRYYSSKGEIPITTTGGKYIALLRWNIYCALEEGGEPLEPVVRIFPLTWELDMANVANGDTIAKTNRPPFIGYAETYYLFGYGDVYENLMKEG